MVYESVFDDDTQDHESNNKCIQAWDSPMSPSSEATRLNMEVVAIYTEEDKKNQNNIPSLAMVVVRKAATSATTNMPSPIMQNLFEDSEKRILRALDRGLDDFMAGKIKLEGMEDTKKNPKNDIKKAQDAIIEEFLEDAAEGRPSVPENDKKEKKNQTGDQSFVEADFEKVTENPQAKDNKTSAMQNEPKENQKSTPKAGPPPPPQSGHEDFAIQAAKKAAKIAAEKQQQQKVSPDFAVAAAKKVAESYKKKQGQNPVKNDIGSGKPPSKASHVKTIRRHVVKSNNDPTTSSIDDNRAFRATFSTPEEYIKTRKQTKKSVTSTNKRGVKGTNKRSKSDVKKSTKEEPSTKASKQVSVENAKKPLNTTKINRKLNLKIMDEEGNIKDPSEESPKDEKKKTPKKEKSETNATNTPLNDTVPSDEEIMKTAQQVLDEIAEQGTDLSAEELLEDVLKFGEKQDKENAVGSGFVSGAFEKAKELLKEQKKQRDARLQEKATDQMKTEVASHRNTDASVSGPGPELGYKEMSSEEDELKRMFEAGERLADGRISLASMDTSTADVEQKKMTEKDEEVVDELIAGDKSISDHARVLDDELAELELRINQSPGEESDGPAKNPVFDIFSGPEVYNPNVDPETAVNWPGAMPGSKALERNKLPKELNEAIKQAKFAAGVLTKMEERDGPTDEEKSFFVGNKELSQQQVNNLQSVVNEAVEIGLIADPLVLMAERSRLQMVLDELWDQPEERFREILSNFKDLLLSDNFVTLVKERLQTMADRDLDALRRSANDENDQNPLEEMHAREREILGQLVAYAQLLLKEARALGAELEAQQLEVIRSICKVAMDPSHRTEEDTAEALTDAVRDMRPLFDDMFVAYLKYAVAEEEGRLARAGVLDDPEHNQWLFVLKIVQQGVYAEIAKGINRYIEHIWYVLRMETATERRMLLSKLIDVMPTMDVRPFVRVVDNIVGSLGEAAKGEFDGAYTLGEMTNKLLQLHRDVKELLPPERIDAIAKDADEWAAKQKQRLMEQRKLTKQRLKAARDTEHLDDEIEALGKRGETERFD